MASVPPPDRPCLRLFGAGAVLAPSPDKDEKILISLGKPLALLAYLALAPNRSASRDRLADLLWGDQERSNARGAVRRTLSTIRGKLGTWVAFADDVACTLSVELRCDALEFSRHIAAGRLEEALSLYRGDFLGDFAAPGSKHFEAWADIERAHFRSAASRAAEALCRSALDQGRLSDARRFATRFREIDPHAELGWRLLLEALIASGDRVSAIAEATRFESWLAGEELEPEPSSRALIRAARQTGARTPERGTSQVALVTDLIGREREFRSILDAWQSAAGGVSRILTVHGGAGIGKTRLLESFASRLASLRKRVVLVRAYPGERGIANAFVANLVFELARLPGASGVPSAVIPYLISIDARLADHFSSSAVAPVAPSPSSRVTALRELMAAVSDETPLALLIDDAHWCDDESRQIIAGALARLESSAALIIIAGRVSTTGFDVEQRATSLPLGPFSQADVAALIESIGTLPAGVEWPAFLVNRVTAASRGIPLLIVGAIEELVTAGALVLSDSGWTTPNEGQLRERLRNINALATRLRALSPDALDLLAACSMVGRPLPPALVADIARGIGVSVDNARRDLEQLGYLRESAAGLEVGHDAVAETVMDLMDPNRRTVIARVLGQVLCTSSEVLLVEIGLRQIAASSDMALPTLALTRAMHARTSDGHANPRQLIAHLTGLAADDPRTGAALRRMPLSVRYPRWRRAVAASAGAAILVAGSAAVLAARANRVAEPALVILLGDRHAASTLPLNANTWAGGTPLATLPGSPRDTLPPMSLGKWIAPDGKSRLIGIDSRDSGGADVALIDEHDQFRRLTWSHADESPESWSPDGRRILISTSQFAHDHRTLGVLDPSNGGITSYGSLGVVTADAAWSPDGTRIAYMAGDRARPAALLCVGSADGITRSCHPSPAIGSISGWLSPEHVLLHCGMTPHAVVYDVVTGDTTTYLDDATILDLSPDGRWVGYETSDAKSDLRVAPAEHLTSWRSVSVRGPARIARLSWSGAFPAREYLDTLVIESPADSLLVGIPHQLVMRGISNAGHSMPVYATRWSSSDTSIAVVDSIGRVSPRRVGRVGIKLTAGGWRSAVRNFVIATNRTSVALDEDWKSLRASRWVSFGVPLPRTVDDSVLGRAFLNNGDGWYFSGVYSAQSFDARGGLALDIELSTPITRDTGQYIEIGLTTLHRRAELERNWDHRTGYFPAEYRGPGGECVFAYPAGEGPDAKLASAVWGKLRVRSGASVPKLATGAPVHLRAQIFPDARCGLAMDGESPVVQANHLAGIDSIAVLIHGNSVGTRMLVGHLRVTRGIPGGVDWAKAERLPY